MAKTKRKVRIGGKQDDVPGSVARPFLKSQGWEQVGRNRWRSPRDGRIYSPKEACEVAALAAAIRRAS